MDLTFSQDPHRMNWVRPDYPYAEVRMSGVLGGSHAIDVPLEVSTETTRSGDEVRTVIRLRNTSDRPYFSREGDVGILLPLEDRYDLGPTQTTHRCNVHVFAGGTSSYVVALRMGGEPPHLGLVLTEGSLSSYSLERDLERASNDRGCFVLNPSPFVLAAGAETTISWVIFPFTDLEEFYATAGRRADFLRAEWDRYVLFEGEEAELTVRPSFGAASVQVNGVEMARAADGSYRFRTDALALGLGEHVFEVVADGHTVRTVLLVKPAFGTLVERRVRFVAQRQQYAGDVAELEGALLVYDNESESPFYHSRFDVNAGRERVGMGLLLTAYLVAARDGTVTPAHADTETLVRGALDRYERFVRRELVQVETGVVFNDIGGDTYRRLYNAGWYAEFFVLLYRWRGDAEDLRVAMCILQRYYDDGGADFYPVEFPIVDLASALRDAGLIEELAQVERHVLEHARRVVDVGTDYPPSEVNYEQSIVAPAVEILLQTALVTGEAWLVEAARPHLLALEQFQGMQPDYHLNEVAIRHWDGFWFGKRALYGDTFPHYWSALTGNAFARLAAVTGDDAYARRAVASLRGVLPLFFDDGHASCAYVFPRTVNGVSGGFDPYANDQDWGLYFALRHGVAYPGDRADGASNSTP